MIDLSTNLQLSSWLPFSDDILLKLNIYQLKIFWLPTWFWGYYTVELQQIPLLLVIY